MNVNYVILQLLRMHKDASATAHAQDTMLSQNGQARYIWQVVLMTACPITGSVLKYSL